MVAIYIDSDNVIRASMPNDLLVLKRFLELEVGASVALCLELLEAAKVVINEGGKWEWAGNAYELEILPEHVEIRSIWDKEAPVFTQNIDEFTSLISQWHSFVAKR